MDFSDKRKNISQDEMLYWRGLQQKAELRKILSCPDYIYSKEIKVWRKTLKNPHKREKLIPW